MLIVAVTMGERLQRGRSVAEFNGYFFVSCVELHGCGKRSESISWFPQFGVIRHFKVTAYS
jgi:hypothetical protein